MHLGNGVAPRASSKKQIPFGNDKQKGGNDKQKGGNGKQIGLQQCLNCSNAVSVQGARYPANLQARVSR
jgi:hypothetical protein